MFLSFMATSLLLMTGARTAFAHPTDVPLRAADGSYLVPGDTRPYSPRQTCGGCHDYDDHVSIDVLKHQGYVDESGIIQWQEYTVATPEHGIATGKHSNQGRNENYDEHMRHGFEDPFFTSSPGMWGKF